MMLKRTLTAFGLLLGLLALPLYELRAQEAADAGGEKGAVADDWMAVQGAKSKVFLPGEWAYEVQRSEDGVLVTAHGGGGKLQLTLQTVEGKQEATPEKLAEIFETHIAAGTKGTDEKASQGMMRRYAANIEGEQVLFKALFLRHEGTGYMVYMQALASDVAADANLEKAMDSVLKSFTTA